MRTFITLILFLSFTLLQAQSGIKYGNNTTLEAGTIVKTDNNSIYVVGGTQINNAEFAIITKFTKGTYAKVWQKRLDFTSRINDFVFVDNPTNPAEIYIVGQSLPAGVSDNQSFLIKMSTSDGSLICTQKYNHTGPEAFTKIVKHRAPTDPNFPFYILGRKFNPAFPNESTFGTVLLWNINSKCSGSFINWTKEYFLDNTAEFHRGLVDLYSGDLLMTGNKIASVNAPAGGLVVKVSGSGNVLGTAVYSAPIKITDGKPGNSDSDIVLVGEHTLTSGVKKGCALNVNGTLSAVNAINIISLESLERVIYQNLATPTWYSTGRKPKVGGLNNTSSIVRINDLGSSMNGLTSSLDHVNNNEYISDNVWNDASGKLYYTDGRALSGGTFDITVAESFAGTPNTQPNFVCQSQPVNDFEILQLTISSTQVADKVYVAPQQTPFLHNNFDLPTVTFCSQPCTMTTSITLFNNNCQYGDAIVSQTGGTGPFIYQWDLNCDGTIDGMSNAIFPALSSSVCVTVTDATGCTSASTLALTPFDNIRPMIMCPPDIILNCGQEIGNTAITGSATATDNSGIAPTITTTIGTTTITGCSGVTIRTFIATDACGNSASCTQIISSVHDTSPPVFSNCGRKVILSGVLNANGNCGLTTVVVAPDVSDNCDAMVVLSNSFNPTDEDASGYYSAGTTIVTWTAKDDCGNMSMCTDTIIILPCGRCELLSSSLTPIMINEKCCYNINLTNGLGPLGADAISLDVLTPDWIMNTVTLTSGYGFGTIATSGTSVTIENPSGIPLGTTNGVATICMSELNTMANDTQCIRVSWENNQTGLACFDTLKTFCQPPVEKDTCFAISNLVIECDPTNDNAYCVSMTVTNLSAFNIVNFNLDALPAGYTYGNCVGCTPSGFPSLGGWYFNWFSMPLLPTMSKNVCFKITSSNPILSPTTICTLGNVEGLNKCCHSPKPICFTLNPCCDPCEDISVSLTPLQNQDTCCYRLDIDYTCDYEIFNKIELDLLSPGVTIGSFSLINSAWTASISTPGYKICFTPTSGHITSANDGALVNFCITGVDDPSEFPQYLNINYYSDINDNDTILCDTLLRLECEDIDHPCVIVKDQTVECDTANNKYIITMYVENHSNPAFTATQLAVFSGPSIVPFPVPLSPPLVSGGPGQTVVFCYVPPVFPEPSGQLIVVYNLKDAMGNCCEGGEIFYDTIPLPPCGPCTFNKCDMTEYQFDIEDKPIGDLPPVIHTGIFPISNNPQIVQDGCNGTSKSIKLRGTTKGFAGESIGVKSGGVAGQDTLGKKNETCCLTFCRKMQDGSDGILDTTATLEVYANGFMSGESQLVGYYSFSNNALWAETQIFFTHSFNVKNFIFRNVSTGVLDGPPAIFIDDIRIGKTLATIDNTPPVITCPSDIFVTPVGIPCIYNYTFPSITAIDDHIVSSLTCTIDGVTAVNSVIYPLGFGPHNVTCIAIDSCGNLDSCAYNIVVDCNPIDPICKCPSDQTTFNLLSNGVNFTLGCNQTLDEAPKLGCPASDVLITGSFACVNNLTKDTCESFVQFDLDRPGSLPNILGSSTLSSYIGLNFTTFEVGAPGIYTLTISTVCPGSNDTCKCIINWIQEECPIEKECKCGGFSKVKFCDFGTNIPILAECNLPDKVYQIPCPSSTLINFCGKFICKPDSCTPPTVNFTLTNLSTGIQINTSTLVLSATNSFTINLLSAWCTDPAAVYEISMKGICGADTCVCKVKFRVECPPQSNLCKCGDKFIKDVANGFLQSSVVGNCIRKFDPIALCPGDRVDWYRNGVYIATTAGISSFTMNVGFGSNLVCMIVTRTEGPNMVCKDTFCSKTYCKPGIGIKSCGGIENASMDNSEDDFLFSSSTMDNWKQIAGQVYAFANEGISEGNIMFIASKDNSPEVGFRWTPIVPKPKIKSITMDIESYIPMPIPNGTIMEVYGITASGQRILVSTIDIAGPKKGWNSFVKGEIANLPDDVIDFSLRVNTSSNEQVFVRIDNICFDFLTKSIDELNNNFLTVYPNPTTGLINLQFATQITSKMDIEVTDILGKILLVDRYEVGDLKHEINLSHFTTGIYILKLTDKDGTITLKKVIKAN
jgi:hypothetical protein